MGGLEKGRQLVLGLGFPCMGVSDQEGGQRSLGFSGGLWVAHNRTVRAGQEGPTLTQVLVPRSGPDYPALEQPAAGKPQCDSVLSLLLLALAWAPAVGPSPAPLRFPFFSAN